MAQSLATFEPSRTMRLLGLAGLIGGVVYLWVFFSFSPFNQGNNNWIRLGAWWLGGAAVAIVLLAGIAVQVLSPQLLGIFIDAALHEVHRVLAPGARFVHLVRDPRTTAADAMCPSPGCRYSTSPDVLPATAAWGGTSRRERGQKRHCDAAKPIWPKHSG